MYCTSDTLKRYFVLHGKLTKRANFINVAFDFFTNMFNLFWHFTTTAEFMLEWCFSNNDVNLCAAHLALSQRLHGCHAVTFAESFQGRINYQVSHTVESRLFPPRRENFSCQGYLSRSWRCINVLRFRGLPVFPSSWAEVSDELLSRLKDWPALRPSQYWKKKHTHEILPPV